MRILQNAMHKETDYYMRQPTNKKLRDSVRNYDIYTKQEINDNASAGMSEYTAEGAAHTTEISSKAKALQEKTDVLGAEEIDEMKWLNVTKGSNGKYTVHFKSVGQIAAILEKGYMVIDGQKVTLDKQQMKRLSAVGKQMEKDCQTIANKMMMEQQLANARQQSDSWKKATQQQSRAMTTATRMMKGRHVSEADEKELAEISPELYKLAKSVGAMEKIKESQREREEDRKISEANDKERDWENEPKDYSTPPRSAYPTYETQINVDVSSGEPQIKSVGEITIPPANG